MKVIATAITKKKATTVEYEIYPTLGLHSRPVFIAAQYDKRFSAHSQGPIRLPQIADPWDK